MCIHTYVRTYIPTYVRMYHTIASLLTSYVNWKAILVAHSANINLHVVMCVLDRSQRHKRAMTIHTNTGCPLLSGSTALQRSCSH